MTEQQDHGFRKAPAILSSTSTPRFLKPPEEKIEYRMQSPGVDALSKEKARKWIFAMKNYLIGKKLAWVVLPTLDKIDTTHALYEQANAVALFALSQSVSDIDSRLFEDDDPLQEVSASIKWHELIKRYDEKDSSKERILLKQFFNYQMKSDQSIREAYSDIQSLASRIRAQRVAAKVFLTD